MTSRLCIIDAKKHGIGGPNLEVVAAKQIRNMRDDMFSDVSGRKKSGTGSTWSGTDRVG